ncbi:MAG TPA: hypothetical protein VHI13_20160 [Candidatus Kapabacteria bacterium]|nr:hypothetical protein [Candidatus Kapabacteria bacterium]
MPPKRAGNGEPGVGERDPGSTVPAASGSIPAGPRADGPPNVAARTVPEPAGLDPSDLDRSGLDPSGTGPYTGEPEQIAPRYIEHPRAAASGSDAGPEDREAGPTSAGLTQSGAGEEGDLPPRFAIDAPPVLPRMRADAASAGEAAGAEPLPEDDAAAVRESGAERARAPHASNADGTAAPKSPARHAAEGTIGTVRAVLDRGERNGPQPQHNDLPQEAASGPAGERGTGTPEVAGRTSVIGTVRSALRRMFSPQVRLEPMKAEVQSAPDENRAVQDAPRSRVRSAEPRAAWLPGDPRTNGHAEEAERSHEPHDEADGNIVPSAVLRSRDTTVWDPGSGNGHGRAVEHDAGLDLSPPVRGAASEIGAGRDLAAAHHNARAAERAAVESRGGLARVRELIRSVVRPRGAARTESYGPGHPGSNEAPSRGEVPHDGGSHRPSVNGRSGRSGETPGARAVIETVNRLTDRSAAGELRLPTVAVRGAQPVPADAGTRRGDATHASSAGRREEPIVAAMQEMAVRRGKESAERRGSNGSERHDRQSPEHRMREHRSVVRRDESHVRSMLEQVGGREAAGIEVPKQASLQPVRLHHSRRESMLHEKGGVAPGAPNSTTPSVKISIGRIEVRAAERKEPPAPQPRTATRGPELSLSEYLKQRNREHR